MGEREEYDSLQDAQGRDAHSTRPARYADDRQDSARHDAAEVRARHGRGVCRFSADAACGAGVFDRLLLLGASGGDGALWRDDVQEGPERSCVDQHGVRRDGREHVVAGQGPVARRSGVDGHQCGGAQRADGCFEWKVCGQDRPGRWLHALGLACELRDQQLRCVAEHWRLRALWRGDDGAFRREAGDGLLRAAGGPR